jgi:hypothetical protein
MTLAVHWPTSRQAAVEWGEEPDPDPPVIAVTSTRALSPLAARPISSTVKLLRFVSKRGMLQHQAMRGDAS